VEPRFPSVWYPSASVESLTARAEFYRRLRNWFYQQNILEVETPQLSAGATTDPQIESFAAGSRYLRTSAEFHHKRLLASGCPDLYELGKVFRVDESGRYHNPEFTMLEWYRLGIDHHRLIANVESLFQYLHADETLGIERISYRALWMQQSNIDLAHAQCSDISMFLNNAGIAVPETVAENIDALQNLAMGTVIADSLPQNQYTAIYDYPASQASLARIDATDANWPVASRFEIYYGSVELANGFHELTDADEQLARFEADNVVRTSQGRSPMPIDINFIRALEKGLPDCAGVAIGIDRLMMVLLDDITELQQTISFGWSQA